MAFATLLAAAGLLACGAPGHAIVTEVYYDAAGDDTGWEFVELHNPFAHALPLAGARIEAGDGSAPGRWTLRWTGAPGDTLRAGARFVVGGSRVSPPPDAIVSLDLQNGPDALRVVWPGGATEVVGWGAHEFAEYACGAAAPDAPSGFSLARIPDESDAGGNALDFRVSAPSPGAPNQAGRDLAVVRGTLRLSPAQPAPGAQAELSLLVANAGREPLDAGVARLLVSGDALEPPSALALGALESGETLRVALGVRAAFAGRAFVRAAVELPGDAAALNDADTLRVRVGVGPLELTEIQFHPAQGEGEWVEVRNRSGLALALAGFTLGDRSGAAGRVLSAAWLAPESLAVLVQDRAAFTRAFPQLDSARVAAVSPWASLNNSNDENGVADVVMLRESDALPVDEVPYSASGVAAGVPLEKADGLWAAAAGAPGTPLAPPRVARPGAFEFDVAPRRVAGPDGDVMLAWRLPWPRARVTVELFDLDGRRAGVLLNDVASTAAGERRVRLDGARPGLFVAQLRARSDTATLTRSALLRIVREDS